MSNEGFRRVVRHYAPKCPINTLFWNKNIKCWFLWLELFIWVWDFSWTIFWWNLAFCLSCPKWCYTYTLPVEIKALEHQTFSTQFISKFKFRLFLITLKLTFFTHPNIKIPKNKMVMPQCIEGVFMLFSKIHDPHPLQKFHILWLPSFVIPIRTFLKWFGNIWLEVIPSEIKLLRKWKMYLYM